MIRLATVTRADVANAVPALARQPHDPCERHGDGVMKVLKFLNKTKGFGLTFKRGHCRLSPYLGICSEDLDDDMDTGVVS